jgi:hypothetical protein
MDQNTAKFPFFKNKYPWISDVKIKKGVLIKIK